MTVSYLIILGIIATFSTAFAFAESDTIITVEMNGPSTFYLDVPSQIIRATVEYQNYHPSDGYSFMKVTHLPTNKVLKDFEIYPKPSGNDMWAVQIAYPILESDIKVGGQTLLGEYEIHIRTEFGSQTASTKFSILESQDEPETKPMSPESSKSSDLISVNIPAGTSVPGCEEARKCYFPSGITIDVGDTIEWENWDTASHTVTAGTPADGPSGEFDSGLFSAGTTFSHTFEAEGEFPYFCAVHPWMNGIVIVGENVIEETPPKPLPSPSSASSKVITVKIPKDTKAHKGCQSQKICYIPTKARIEVGQTIEWINLDSAEHTVTSGTLEDGPSGKFDSGLLASGTKFSYTFEKSGEFDYYCTLHPGDNGIVIATFSVDDQLSRYGVDVFTDKASYDSVEVVKISIRLNPNTFTEVTSTTIHILGDPDWKDTVGIDPLETYTFEYIPDESYIGESKISVETTIGSKDETFFFVGVPDPILYKFNVERSFSTDFYDQEFNPDGYIPIGNNFDEHKLQKDLIRLSLENQFSKPADLDKETNIEDFPDGPQSPEYYIEKYHLDEDFRWWFEVNFDAWLGHVLGVDKEQYADIVNEIGKDLAENEDFETSYTMFYYAHRLQPNNSKYLTNLAADDIEMGRYNDAISSAKKAQLVNATDDVAFAIEADSHFELGNSKKAIKLYEKALELNPNDIWSLSFLGILLTESGDEKGLEFVEKSLELEPENTDLIFNKASSLYNLKKYEEALIVLEDFLKIDPDDVEVLEFKQEILEDSGFLKEQRLALSFPEKVDSRCDLVFLINKETEKGSILGLDPGEDARKKIESIITDSSQKAADEPWDRDEILQEGLDKATELSVDSVMEKYSIDSKLYSIVSQMISYAGFYDRDIMVSVLAIDPEHYTEDLECGKMLHYYYHDEMLGFYYSIYGVDVAEKLDIAIDEAIAEAEQKRKSDPIAIIEDTIDSQGGGCLIATATYGSELAPQVQQLRELRDNKLLQTESGSAFMESFNKFYYLFSPYVADYERENPVFREVVKLAITPMISSLSILNHVDMETDAEVLGYGISLILLNVGMYFLAPAIVVVRIRKRL